MRPCARAPPPQVCDALTANLEEKQFFRIRTPATHAEVMTYLSLFAAAESFVVVCASGGGRRGCGLAGAPRAG